VRLNRFDVRGFRSLVDIAGIPIGEPTILAGHNDSGKTAVIDALRYLLGSYKLSDEDRSYSRDDTGSTSGKRCDMTEVRGFFELDSWEQRQFNRSSRVEIRRRSSTDGVTSLEILTDVHEDEALRDLSSAKVNDLRALVKKYGLQPAGNLKADLRSALETFASEHATLSEWLPISRELDGRLPHVLKFGGAAEAPDDAVRTALMIRFTEYTSDPEMRGRIMDLEHEIQDRLRDDAKDLCRHIEERCSDLGEINVDPKVSLREGFAEAPLRIERSSGQPVKLDRSGLGSRKRISLAVWEWTSRLLREDEDDGRLSGAINSVSQDGGDTAGEPPLRQTIVVYDEPDTHLDYRHQRKVMQLVREQSQLEHVNVVVATHSMNIIDGVDIADVVNLKLQADQTVVERLEQDLHDYINGHLGSIAASLGLTNSVLLHERVFLAVEGASEYKAFPLLFRLSEGMSLQSAGIALWDCGGNDGALNLAKYLVHHGRDVVLAVDDDSTTKKMFKNIRLREVFGAAWQQRVEFIGRVEGSREFEAAFTDEVWTRVANSLWPRRDGQMWKESDFEELRQGPKFSTSADKLLSDHGENFQSGKPSMMADLAASLTDPADVPQSLQTLFSRLRTIATY
jgi:putative ATP-dependent endonuclease of the OLD family